MIRWEGCDMKGDRLDGMTYFMAYLSTYATLKGRCWWMESTNECYHNGIYSVITKCCPTNNKNGRGYKKRRRSLIEKMNKEKKKQFWMLTIVFGAHFCLADYQCIRIGTFYVQLFPILNVLWISCSSLFSISYTFSFVANEIYFGSFPCRGTFEDTRTPNRINIKRLIYCATRLSTRYCGTCNIYLYVTLWLSINSM